MLPRLRLGKQLTVNVPDALARRLDARAAVENNSVSTVVRRLVTEGLDREAFDPPPPAVFTKATAKRRERKERRA